MIRHRQRTVNAGGHGISGSSSGFTLMEVLVSLLVVAIMLAGLVSLYTQSAIRAERSAFNLAGQMMALQGLEQARAAKWDQRATPVVDELVSTNFPKNVQVLDLGTVGGGVIMATNRISIQTLSTNPPLKAIRVECTWAFPLHGKIYTNTAFTYRASDQ